MSIERNFTGHEMGDLAELRYGNGGTVSLTSMVNDGTARSGNYYCRQTASSGSTSLSFFPAGSVVGTSGTVSSGSHKRVSMRSYIRIEAVGPNGGQQRVIGFGNDTGSCNVFFGAQNTSGGFVQTGAKIGLRIGSQSHNAVAGAYPWGTVDLTVGVWYRLLLDIDLDVQATTVLSASLRVTEDAASPTVDFTLTNSLNIGATDNLDKFAYGYSTNPGAFGRQATINIDDTLYIGTSNADAVSAATLPTATKIYAIVPPTGAASNVGWTGTYADVDEYPFSAVDTMSSSTAAAEVDFSHATGIALGFSSITAVKLSLNALVSGAGTGSVDYLLNGTAKNVTLGATYPGNTGAADPIGGILWSTLTPAAFSAITFGIRKANGTQATVLANIGLEALASPAAYGSGNQLRGETQIKAGSIYDAQIADGAGIQRQKIQGGAPPVFFPDELVPDDWVIPGPPGASGATTVLIPVVPVFFDADGSGGGDEGVVVPGPIGPTGATGAAGTGGSLVLLESHTASASAELDFTTRNASGQSGASFQSDYDEYLLELVGILPATNNVDLKFQVSTNGGSTYDTSNLYANSIWVWNFSGTAVTGNSIAALVGNWLVRNNAEISNAATDGVNGSARFFDPLSGSRHKQMEGKFSFLTGGGTFNAVTTAHVYRSVTAINAFRLLFTSGNIASGVARLYGIAK